MLFFIIVSKLFHVIFFYFCESIQVHELFKSSILNYFCEFIQVHTTFYGFTKIKKYLILNYIAILQKIDDLKSSCTCMDSQK